MTKQYDEFRLTVNVTLRALVGLAILCVGIALQALMLVPTIKYGVRPLLLQESGMESFYKYVLVVVWLIVGVKLPNIAYTILDILYSSSKTAAAVHLLAHGHNGFDEIKSA